MNAEQVLERYAYIRSIAGDDEAAHAEEDRLRHDVLAAIAAGECVDPEECCRLSLMTSELEFERWCA